MNLCDNCKYFNKGFCEAMGEPFDYTEECDYVEVLK